MRWAVCGRILNSSMLTRSSWPRTPSAGCSPSAGGGVQPSTRWSPASATKSVPASPAMACGQRNDDALTPSPRLSSRAVPSSCPSTMSAGRDGVRQPSPRQPSTRRLPVSATQNTPATSAQPNGQYRRRQRPRRRRGSARRSSRSACPSTQVGSAKSVGRNAVPRQDAVVPGVADHESAVDDRHPGGQVHASAGVGTAGRRALGQEVRLAQHHVGVGPVGLGHGVPDQHAVVAGVAGDDARRRRSTRRAGRTSSTGSGPPTGSARPPGDAPPSRTTGWALAPRADHVDVPVAGRAASDSHCARPIETDRVVSLTPAGARRRSCRGR